MTNDATNPVEVTQADNAETVRLTEWLIANDFFDEDGRPAHLLLIEEFGAEADQAFARHRIASRATDKTLAAETREAVERVGKVANGATINGTYNSMPIAALEAFKADLTTILTSLEGQG